MGWAIASPSRGFSIRLGRLARGAQVLVRSDPATVLPLAPVAGRGIGPGSILSLSAAPPTMARAEVLCMARWAAIIGLFVILAGRTSADDDPLRPAVVIRPIRPDRQL